MLHALRAVVLLLAMVLPGLTQTEPESAPPTFPPTVTEYHTTVKGTVPDLTGRWLAVAWLEIPGGDKRAAGLLWEFTRKDGQLEVHVPYLQVPSKQTAAMEQAAAAKKTWEPSAGDLTDLATSWDRLERNQTRPAKLDSYLTGRDAFDDTFKGEALTKDAQWVLQQTETYDASAAPAVKQVSVASVLEGHDGSYSGKYLSTLMAAAPFPIPITFNGTFQMYRLSASSKGLLARIADFLQRLRQAVSR